MLTIAWGCFCASHRVVLKNRAQLQCERLQERVHEGRMAGLPPDPELRGMLTNLRGLIFLNDPRRKDFARARSEFLAVSEALQAANNPRGLCLVYNNLFLTAAELGQVEAALPDLDRSASLARSIGDFPALETALFTKAWYLTEHIGDYEAAALNNETYRLAKETHQRGKLVWHYYHFATLYLRTGRYQEARETMEHFLASSAFMVNTEGKIQDLADLSRFCVLAGDAAGRRTMSGKPRRWRRAPPRSRSCSRSTGPARPYASNAEMRTQPRRGSRAQCRSAPKTSEESSSLTMVDSPPQSMRGNRPSKS